ncbi:thiol reductant ABC exporter subunit CydD [Psychrosphaera saromensis]|nr:thiol reductant ABC exporter subunit CydD [Psychrosphaera saromensis]
MGIFITQGSTLVNELIPLFIPLFIASTFAWVVIKYYLNVRVAKLQQQVETDIQNRVEQTLNSQQNALCRQYSSYFWQHVWISHIPAISQFLTQYQLQKMLSGLIPVFVIIAIIPINYFVALILLITLPIVPLFMILVGKGAAKLHQQHFIALERLGGLFVDRLKALTLLTSFNQHDTETARLDEASKLVNDRTMRVVGVAFLSTSVLDFFSTVAMALIAVFIGFSILGEISLGPELPFTYGLYLLLVAPLLFSELKNLGSFYHQKALAESAAEAIYPVVKQENTNNQAFANKTGSQNTSWQNLHWQNFHIETPSLKAENLSLQQGEHVFLQGPSGSGKTILLEALMGLRKSSHQLTGKCVLLSQSAVITTASVRSNLMLDRVLPDKTLLDMLNKVELTPWLHSLPNGLDTLMGEHPPLSGGEAQRLALARILLQQADIVLLDEPTAHLTNEQHILLAELINRLCLSQTVIWASHKTLPDNWFSQQWIIEQGEILCK